MEIKMTDEQIHHFIKTLIRIYAEQNGVEIKLTWKGEKAKIMTNELENYKEKTYDDIKRIDELGNE